MPSSSSARQMLHGGGGGRGSGHRGNGLVPLVPSRYDASTVTVSLGKNQNKSNHHKENNAEYVIVAGGRSEDGSALRTVECLDLGVQRAWRLPSFPSSSLPGGGGGGGRQGCALAVLNNVIYCMGGLGSSGGGGGGEEDGEEGPPVVLSSVLQMTFRPPEITKWTLANKDNKIKKAQLTIPRWGAAAATLQDKFVFVLGGRNASWQEVSTAEVGMLNDSSSEDDEHDDHENNNTNNDTPELLKFSKIPYALKEKRFAATAVSISDTTFIVCGGYNNSNGWLTSCCLYEMDGDDPKDGQWRDLPPMPHHLAFPQAVFCPDCHNTDNDVSIPKGGVVFVAGGSGAGYLLMYRVEAEEWTVVDDRATPFANGDAVLILTKNGLLAYGANRGSNKDDDKGVSGWTMPLPQALTQTATSTSATSMTTPSAPSVPSNHHNSRNSMSTTSTPSTRVAGNHPDDVFVVSDAVAVPLGSQSSLGGSNSGHRPSSSFRMVKDMDIFVENEAARYSGPLNEQGQRHGRGFLIWADDAGRYYPKEMSRNTYYEGEFVNDSRLGQGVMFFDKEDRIYRGNFARGVLNGPDGHLFDGRRGIEYTGSFRKGTPSGEGQCVYNNTKQTWKGLWKGGKPLSGEWRDAQGNVLQAGNGPWNADLAVD